MAARRRAYFRTHRNPAARRRFVRHQNAKLKALKRAVARCQSKPASPPPPPPPPPADTQAPDLTGVSPEEGAWLDTSPAPVRGAVADAGSGVAAVTCDDRPTATSAGAFSCDVPLAPGANSIAIRAVDRAGNARTLVRTLQFGPGMLAGPAGAPVRGAVQDVFAPDAAAPSSEISLIDGARVVRTEVQLELADDATVGAVDELLQRLHAHVVSSLRGVALPTVRIPDPGDASGVQQLMDRLAHEPALREADLVAMPVADEVPFPDQGGIAAVTPQIAEGAAAAWNARTALAAAAKPTLLLADFFGDGPPGELFGVTPVGSDFGTGSPASHGYTSLGLAAATFDPLGGDLTADRATGIFPGSALPLRVLDEQRGIGGSVLRDRMVAIIEAAPGHVVVNTSLGLPCSTTPPPASAPTLAARQRCPHRRSTRTPGSSPPTTGR